MQAHWVDDGRGRPLEMGERARRAVLPALLLLLPGGCGGVGRAAAGWGHGQQMASSRPVGAAHTTGTPRSPRPRDGLHQQQRPRRSPVGRALQAAALTGESEAEAFDRVLQAGVPPGLPTRSSSRGCAGGGGGMLSIMDYNVSADGTQGEPHLFSPPPHPSQLSDFTPPPPSQT